MLASNGDTLNVVSIINGGTRTNGIATGGITNFAGSVAATQTLAFSDAPGTLILPQPTAFALAITGFTHGDTINLSGVTANGTTWSNGQLTVSNHGTMAMTLALSGDYLHDAFHVSGITGGSALTTIATCYASGTRI